MAKVYGFGIIGAGAIFDSHALALASLRDRTRLIAVADTDDGKFRDATAVHFAPYTYANHRELLQRDDIDIIVVATPPATHEQLTLEALEAGKFVICEKPLAPTLEGADRIVAAARQYPNRLSVVYQQRFLPEVGKTIWLRDNGWLGELRFGTFRRLATMPPRVAGGGWWGRWEIAGGGVVMTQSIHELDLMIHVFGRPVEASAMMDTLQQDIESEDSFAASARFESGAIASCCATLNAHRFETAFDVAGSLASTHCPWALRCSDSGHRATMEAALHKVFPPATPPRHSLPVGAVRKVLRKLGWSPKVARPPVNCHAAYIAACLDAIDSGGAVPVPPEEARRSLELSIGLYTAALTGTPVTLPLDESSLYYKGIPSGAYRDRSTVTLG